MKALTPPLILAFVLAAGEPAFAENSPATRLSLKGLEGIGVRVEPIAAEAQKDGLSADALQSAVQSQLRKAGLRLLTSQQQRQTRRRPCLRVHVATSKLDTGEYLYSIHVEVNQWVASLADPKVSVTAAVPIPAQTWSPANVFGIAPADQMKRDVQGAVDSMVEEFIDAFYQANPSETAFRARRGGRAR